MCGIAGAWSRVRGESHDTLRRIAAQMAGTLEHRGPDASGVWANAEAGLILAHRRLAVVDLSPTGHQPMVSPSGRYVLIYNGEIYNHHEIRSTIEARCGVYNWRGTSDTETLLAAFEIWGIEAGLQRSVGMFALAVWDLKTHTLNLARDRFGEKPLFYGSQGDHFYFASELRAIESHPRFRKEVDASAVRSFLENNYIATRNSIWSGIKRLPPGTLLTLSAPDGAARPVPYWSAYDVAAEGTRSPLSCTRSEAADLVEIELRRAVRGQMLSDVPIGALLSGGIDSSLVVALMQEASSKKINTYSIGFAESEFDESAFARRVAAHIGTDHSELIIETNNVLDIVPQMSSVYDEPFADSSQLPTFILMKFAREEVKVALSGDGGDEVFGGYNQYTTTPSKWKQVNRIPSHLRLLAGDTLGTVSPHSWSSVLGWATRGMDEPHIGHKIRRIGWALKASESFFKFQRCFSTQWNGELQRLMAFDTTEAGETVPQPPPLGDHASEMMAYDLVSYLPDDILAKVDRAAMAASLETRAPLLDHALVELAWSLPIHYKISAEGSKVVLKDVLSRHIPRSLFDRPKQGFSVPLDQWLRGPLRDWCESLLSPPAIRKTGLLNSSVVQDVWTEHLKGGAHGYKIWSVLMLQAWLQQRQFST